MNKFLLMAGLAAVLTTGLMGDKCSYAPAPQQSGDEQKKDEPAKAPEPTPTPPPAQ